MLDTQKFYESYWKEREEKGRLHTLPGMWVPPRILISTSMLIKQVPLKEGTSIIDIGCGEGMFGKILGEKAARMNKSGYTISGVDISSTALKHAGNYYSEVFQLNVESGSLKNLFKDKKFDCAVCLEMLEHLFDPGKALVQIHSILKPGGTFITSFPNIAFWKYRLDMLLGEFPIEYTLHDPAEHIQNFTIRSFCRILRKTGFKVQSIDAFVPVPFFLYPKKLFRTIMRKFPALFGYQIVIKARSIQ
jgi:2-polyprenyl-3-methyl-5-hydroxy-6-metoxy-1,4-benzoquinol methylase